MSSAPISPMRPTFQSTGCGRTKHSTTGASSKSSGAAQGFDSCVLGTLEDSISSQAILGMVLSNYCAKNTCTLNALLRKMRMALLETDGMGTPQTVEKDAGDSINTDINMKGPMLKALNSPKEKRAPRGGRISTPGQRVRPTLA